MNYESIGLVLETIGHAFIGYAFYRGFKYLKKLDFEMDRHRAAMELRYDVLNERVNALSPSPITPEKSEVSNTSER